MSPLFILKIGFSSATSNALKFNSTRLTLDLNFDEISANFIPKEEKPIRANNLKN